jgi:hypothetical protein
MPVVLEPTNSQLQNTTVNTSGIELQDLDLSSGTVSNPSGALLDHNGEQDSLERVEIEEPSFAHRDPTLELHGTMQDGVQLSVQEALIQPHQNLLVNSQQKPLLLIAQQAENMQI